MTTLSLFEAARARSNSYLVFGRLFRYGATEETLHHLRAIPALCSCLAEPFNRDQVAAAHQELFGFNVFAHESMFLSPDAVLGGPVAESVSLFYMHAGRELLAGADADHISRELDLLAFLCVAESSAWEIQQRAEIARLHAVQRDFLDRHLLRWLPGLAMAIGQHDQPLYTAAASLLLELALDHRASLGDDLIDAGPRFALPAAPDLLSDERAGLRDIAEYLLTTAHSGIYLSRDDIGRLGRQHKLPTGFGSRRIMLTNLLRSAAEFDAIGPLTGSLQDMAARWQAGYTALCDHPSAAVQAIGQTWSERVARTDRLLSKLAEAASYAPAPARPEGEYEDE